MELVIKLNEETYKEVMDRTENDTLSLGIKLIEAVQNGRPLPENLICRDFMKEMGATCIAKRISTGELVAISSIDELTEELGKIEADKAESEDKE